MRGNTGTRADLRLYRRMRLARLLLYASSVQHLEQRQAKDGKMGAAAP